MTVGKVDHKPNRSARRRARYRARSVLWQVSSLDRVRACGLRQQGTQSIKVAPNSLTGVRARSEVASAVVRREPGITLRVEDSRDGRRGSWSGVQSCGSTWACPVCSESIQAERSAEVARAIRTAHGRGWVVGFLTFTVRHSSRHSLAGVWAAVSAGWRRATSGSRAAWADDRADYGVQGYLRLVEVTHGANGWHVHVHSLVLLDPSRAALFDPSAETPRLALVRGLADAMRPRWEAGVKSLGRGYAPSKAHGVDARLVTTADGLGEYFGKNLYSVKSDEQAALEVTSSSSKQGRRGNVTPFGLLARYTWSGDPEALKRWHEWEQVSRGKRQLLWSNGLRLALGMAPEAPDVDVANTPAPGRDVVRLTPQGYRAAVRAGLVTKLLDAAEHPQWRHRVEFLLLEAGIWWEWPDPPVRPCSRWAPPPPV